MKPKQTRRMAIVNTTCVSFCNQPKAHFGLPWVRPWDNRGKFTLMKRGFNACQTHCSMYPSTFNRFPVIQPVSSKIRHFSTFWPTLGTPLVNVTWMERGFNAGQTHSSIPIYLQPFTSYSEIILLVGNCNFFPTPLQLGVFPLEFRENV